MFTIRKLKVTFAVTSIVFLCGYISAAHAATYYVATNGNDSNSGASTQPFRTIGKGVTRLAPGDTLIIRGGTYVEPALNNTIPGGSSWSAPVTVKGNPGETVVFQPTTTVPGINIRAGRRFIRIDGIGIDMTRVTNIEGIKIHELSSDIELLNLNIRNIVGDSGNAIVVGDGSQRVTVRGSKLHDIVQTPLEKPGNHGIYMRGSFSLFENNEFYNIQGYGMQLYSSAGGVNDNIIRNNVFRNVGIASLLAEGGITVYSGNRNKVYGNLVYNCYGAGITVKQSYNEIYNNTVYNCHQFGIHIAGSNNIIKNNIIYKNGITIKNMGTGTILSGNFVTDPWFVNEMNGDFHLKSGSPAAGLGAYGTTSTSTSGSTLPAVPGNLQAVAQ